MFQGGSKSEELTGVEREVDPYWVWEETGLGMFPFWKISVVKRKCLDTEMKFAAIVVY